MGNPHSGKFGAISGVSGIRNWNISDENTTPTLKASNLGGGTGRSSGIKKWSGSFSAYGIVPIVMPSETYSFIGFTAPDTDVGGTNGLRYTGTIMVDSVTITWNWKTGQVIDHTVNFTGSGLLAFSVAAAITDETAIAAYPVCGTKLMQSVDDETYAEVTDLVQATFTITAANQDSINSSTACAVVRKAGNIDWTLAVQQEKTLRDITLINTDYFLRLYVDATDYWQLSGARCLSFTGIKVDVESNAIIDRTINFGMQAQMDGALGVIIKPGEVSEWWPF